MLAILRRHVGWSLKVILGVIVLSFVFYFGYTSLQGPTTRESSAIQVGDEVISMAKYRFFYNNVYEEAKEQFKGEEIPEFYLKFIQDRARQQAIYRNMMRQFAEEIGIQVTDQELADAITKQKDFDPVQYKNFLKTFYYQNTFSYEDLIREDLLIQKFQNWAQKQQTFLATTNFPKTVWTFETLEIKDKTKKALAEEIQTAWAAGQDLKNLLKKSELEPKKVGPMTLQQRQQLFLGPLALKDYQAIFILEKARPALEKPIETGEGFLLVRLLGKKEGETKESNNQEISFNVVDVWFRHFTDQLEIKSFLPSPS